MSSIVGNSKLGLPFAFLAKNKRVQPWDEHVRICVKNEVRFDKIIQGDERLRLMKLPVAWKEVAKSIFALGREPELIGQGFDIKGVMGAVGEALTELLLPGEEGTVNSMGHDAIYKGNYIEVKSTVARKVTMSNPQYRGADYLVMHRFHKETGRYYNTYLIPMNLLRFFKFDRVRSVSVDLAVDTWARALSITLERLVIFFKLISNESTASNSPACSSCHAKVVRDGVFRIQALVDLCVGCGWTSWELRYAYYDCLVFESHFRAKRRKIGEAERDFKDLDLHYGKAWRFSVTIDKDGNRSVHHNMPARIVCGEKIFSLDFCPSWYFSSKLPKNSLPLNFDFYKLYRALQKYNRREDSPIRDVRIEFDESKLVVRVRSGLACTADDGEVRFYTISELNVLSCEYQIVKLIRELKAIWYFVGDA
ncbi:hypothetical protein [Pseudomonas koreensis]|uniref:hypothetical protein n=1 Tax=Pseudomonas koreensis TaxID=198620 RepID=UPI002FCB58CF